MYKILVVLFLVFGAWSYSQSIDYNTKKGYAANGYDVVSYFDKNPREGKEEFAQVFDGVKYKFLNRTNLESFVANPDAFLPIAPTRLP